ncbi:MAG: single-stranded DNA-binding protein [Candidatus Azambacteria bacterium]|nr:single-stranded DNA-binding protein [Candidatus Azambacteria bacterium]
MNLNKVFLLGRLTADPQLRMTAAGKPVVTFSLATNRLWINQQGQRQEDTQYHSIVIWGRQAEVANQFLRKGGLVLIEGRLQTRTWKDQQGQNRKTTEIIADRIQLGPRAGSGGSGGGNFGERGGESNFDQRPSKPREESSQDESSEVLPEINLDEIEAGSGTEEIPF